MWATRPGTSSISRLESSTTIRRLTLSESPFAATGPRAKPRSTPSMTQ